MALTVIIFSVENAGVCRFRNGGWWTVIYEISTVSMDKIKNVQ